jgi:transcriptional regulator with GAF, ATPase, and Fis domain
MLTGAEVIDLSHLPHERLGRTLPHERISEPPPFRDPPSYTLRPGAYSMAPGQVDGGAAHDAPDTPPFAEDERARIIRALDQCAGNQTHAARLLGVSRRTLISRIERYQLPRPRKRDGAPR